MRRGCFYIFLSLLCLLVSNCTSLSDYQTITGYTQGGSFHITYSCRDSSGAIIPYSSDSVSAIVNDILHDIDFSLSGYNKGSILSKVNNNEECELDSLFISLFKISYRIYLETDGHFDVTGAPLFDYWGFGFEDSQDISVKRQRAQTRSAIDSILEFVGMDKISIEDGHIIKKDSRIKLNFNAIAQGFSCDVIAQSLQKMGICNYLVDVGMEIVCKGVNSRGKKWKIGIDAPVDGNMMAGENIKKIMEVTDCGIVTSGNYRKYYYIDGRKYSHTIDPVTGYPVSHHLLSATVIAPDATTADALATYCMVVGPVLAPQFISEHPELELFMICD